MEAMKPMKPMKPMAEQEQWWSDDLGKPSSSGSSNGMQYAVFPGKQRLAVKRGGAVKLYDIAGHDISGVSSQSGAGNSTLSFSDGRGSVKLEDLKEVG